jgi:hypothetical protein
LVDTQFLDFLFGKESQEEIPQSICSNNFKFDIKNDPNTQELVFDITISKGSWFGFGYSCSMTNSDMFLIEADADGNITLKDLYSKGAWYPATDKIQDYSEPYDISEIMG